MLEFRAEGFNVLNHPNWGIPGQYPGFRSILRLYFCERRTAASAIRAASGILSARPVDTSCGALIGSLRFDEPDTEPLRALDDADWNALLGFTDRTHMTLTLARRRELLPAWVRQRIDRNVRDNIERTRRTQAAYLEIAAAFEQRGIEWAVLKGFSHDIADASAVRHRSAVFAGTGCHRPADRGRNRLRATHGAR